MNSGFDLPGADPWLSRLNPDSEDVGTRISVPGSDGQFTNNPGGSAGLVAFVQDLWAPPEQQRPALQGDTYDAREDDRVLSYQRRWDQLSDLGRAALAWGMMPQALDLRSSQGDRTIELRCSNFAQIFETIPGLRLERPIRQLLEGIRGISIRDNTLRLEGQANITVGGMVLTLNNVTMEVVPDPANPNRFRLRNIQGLSAFGLMNIREAELTLRRDDPDGVVRLQVEVLNPLPRALRAGMASLGVPQEDRIRLDDIPLGLPATVNPIVEELRLRPQDRNYVRMVEAMTGADLPQEIRTLLGSITGRSRRGDNLVVTRTGASSHDLGGLTLSLAQTIEARVRINEREARLENVRGISFDVPLPAELRQMLGLQNMAGHIRAISLSAADANGHRRLRIELDDQSLVESLEIRVGADLHPVLERGNMTVDLVARRRVRNGDREETVRLPMSVSFNPEQVANPPQAGPDFTIRLTGRDEDYLRVAESLFPGVNLAEVRDLFRGVQSISKQGDRITIQRAESTTRDMGGIDLSVGRTVSMRVSQQGNRLRIHNIQGISMTLQPEMPDAVTRFLGVNIGRIPVGITALNIVNESGGRQRVILEGNNLLSRVGLVLRDGAPELGPDGRWNLYAMVQIPPTEQERRERRPLREMGVILPFNRDNQIALRPEETAALVGQVAFQNIDLENPRTWGLSLIAIGAQVTSSTIPAVENFQRGVPIAVDRFQNGLEQIRSGAVVERFQDGARQVPGRFMNGLQRIGGFLGIN